MATESLKRRLTALEGHTGSSDMLHRMRMARERVEAGQALETLAPLQGAGPLIEAMRRARARVTDGVIVDAVATGPVVADPLNPEHGELENV